MLTDEACQRYAEVMLWALQTARRSRFRRGDAVALRFGLPGLPLAERIYALLIAKGFNPVVKPLPSAAMERAFYRGANRRQLAFVAPGEEDLYRHLHGSIYIHAPESLTHLEGVDPERIGRSALARKPLKDILDRRDEAGAFGWTLCAWPTAEAAAKAGLNLEAYGRQIVRACFLDRSDPVAQWRRTLRRASAIKAWLDALPVRALRLTSARCDLEIVPGAHRRWLGLSGHNIPSFEIFISPDWRGTRGHFYADQPSYRSGNRVSGVRLEFAQGRVCSASAQEGEPFLKRQLAVDPGACRLGEFSLTDRRFSRIACFMANTLFDENFGGAHGNCHVALGSAYTDSFAGDPARLTARRRRALGFNESALHWDLVNTEDRQVEARLADGRTLTIYRDGKFLY
jgi:aminopeptidase